MRVGIAGGSFANLRLLAVRGNFHRRGIDRTSNHVLLRLAMTVTKRYGYH